METELIVGKNYYFDSVKDDYGTLISKDSDFLVFKPIIAGCYFPAVGSDGLLRFHNASSGNFYLADHQPEDLHETQKKKILEYLKTGKSITKLEALKMFGCWNSGDAILHLRRAGHKIETTMITNGKKRFASYKLIENGKEN